MYLSRSKCTCTWCSVKFIPGRSKSSWSGCNWISDNYINWSEVYFDNLKVLKRSKNQVKTSQQWRELQTSRIDWVTNVSKVFWQCGSIKTGSRKIHSQNILQSEWNEMPLRISRSYRMEQDVIKLKTRKVFRWNRGEYKWSNFEGCELDPQWRRYSVNCRI